MGVQALGRGLDIKGESFSFLKPSSKVRGNYCCSYCSGTKTYASGPCRGQHLLPLTPGVCVLPYQLIPTVSRLPGKLASAWGKVVPSPNKAPIPSPIFKLSLSSPAPETAKHDLLGTSKELKGDSPFLNQLPG